MSLVALDFRPQLGQDVVHPKVTDHGVVLGTIKDDGRVGKHQVLKHPVLVPQDRNRGRRRPWVAEVTAGMHRRYTFERISEAVRQGPVEICQSV
ncbi:hypothetical protein A4E84_11575 [Streptomyces qaidamensis]|uniref:Uncharacterized protein n=1 Tax=Streptomyces qaidamensis TaxID=1783515 RepID=A0A143BXY7_9ACTN|nr:hypothetical protein A4E84_11575 [Streptomyces qaidamensis]